MLEKTIVAKILKYLREQGAWAEKVHGSAYQRKGMLDIVGCYRGQFFAIEVKVFPNQPTEIQQHVMDEITKSGGIAIVAWSIDDARSLVAQMMMRD